MRFQEAFEEGLRVLSIKLPALVEQMLAQQFERAFELRKIGIQRLCAQLRERGQVIDFAGFLDPPRLPGKSDAKEQQQEGDYAAAQPQVPGAEIFIIVGGQCAPPLMLTKR